MPVNRRSRGFSLIELLIVMVIIAILVLVAIPAISNYRSQARVSAVQSDVRNAGTAAESAYISAGAYPADATLTKASPGFARVSDGVTLTVHNYGSDRFCIDGKHSGVSNGSDLYYYSSFTDASVGLRGIAAGVNPGTCGTGTYQSGDALSSSGVPLPPAASQPATTPVATLTGGNQSVTYVVSSSSANTTSFTATCKVGSTTVGTATGTSPLKVTVSSANGTPVSCTLVANAPAGSSAPTAAQTATPTAPPNYLLATASGVIASANGTAWSGPTAVAGITPTEVDYIGTTWYLLGSGGLYATSSDGLTWSAPVNTGNGGSLKSIAVSGSSIVAVGSGGISYSGNAGASWSTAKPGAFTYDSVTNVNGTWYAAASTSPSGSTTSAVRSSDGTSWVALGQPDYSSVNSVASVGTTLYANTHSGLTYRTTNGAVAAPTWTSPANAYLPGGFIQATANGSKLFFIADKNGSDPAAAYQLSGASWIGGTSGFTTKPIDVDGNGTYILLAVTGSASSSSVYFAQQGGGSPVIYTAPAAVVGVAAK